jgi:neutral amino acid transport system permease protein
VPRDKTEVGLSQLAAKSKFKASALFGVLAIFFSIFLGASPAMAQVHQGDNTQTDFSITGTLLNADKPLVGVSITATGAKDFSQTVKSDDTGAWTIYVPAEAKYTVKLDLKTLPSGVSLTNAADASQEVDLTGLGFAGVGFDFGAATENQQSFGEQLMIRVFSGLNFGLLLAIAAIGISLIYGTTGLNNFAHGEMVTLGALLMWVFYTLLGWNILVASLVSIVIIAFSGFVQNQFLWKPLRKRRLGLNQMMIVSIGLSIVARYLMLIFFDGDTKDISGGGNPVTFGPIETTDVILVSMGLNLVALAGVALFLTRTRLGKATRAVSDNPSLAESSGIDVEKIIRTIWILAGALTGLSGVLYGLQFQANWELGYNILLLLFAAVTLGGLGTSLGATVGALIIGMVVEVSPLFIPNEMKYAVALVILILILLFRPQGVLGKKQRIG